MRFSDVPGVRELWDEAVAASAEPMDLTTAAGARASYSNTLRRFLTRLVRDEPRANQVRAYFEKAGLRFLRDEAGDLKQAMPVVDLPDIDKYRQDPRYAALFIVSGQHVRMISEDCSRAVDPENLVFMTGRDNSLMDVRGALARAVRAKTVQRWT